MENRKKLLKWLLPVLLGIGAGITVIVLSGISFLPGKKATVKLPDIKVYIRGEVNSPGLYEIPADMRLCELIENAGGATKNADLERLNLAAILTDGTTITVPSVTGGEQASGLSNPQGIENVTAATATDRISQSTDKITSGTVNINTATAAQLMQLPGVGEATANKIISYRTEHGKFLAIEEIMNVSGIGEKKFESMKPFLTVE